MPKDDSQKIYVWFDALSIYLTSIGFGWDEEQFQRLWPADMHVIGKGIIRFHAAYWPAMLLSAGLKLPREIMVHGYVTSKGQKMSKSLGNVVDPIAILDKYGKDSTRYYLLRSIPTFEDGDFSEDELAIATNAELVGNIGNFVHRTLTFACKNYNGNITASTIEKDEKALLERIGTLVDEYDDDLSNVRIGRGLNKVLEISSIGNKYFQDNKPWEMVNGDKNRCEMVLFTCISICKTLSTLLYPYLPDASERLSGYLNAAIAPISDAKPTMQGAMKISEPKMLFHKIERAEIK